MVATVEREDPKTTPEQGVEAEKLKSRLDLDEFVMKKIWIVFVMLAFGACQKESEPLTPESQIPLKVVDMGLEAQFFDLLKNADFSGLEASEVEAFNPEGIDGLEGLCIQFGLGTNEQAFLGFLMDHPGFLEEWSQEISQTGYSQSSAFNQYISETLGEAELEENALPCTEQYVAAVQRALEIFIKAAAISTQVGSLAPEIGALMLTAAAVNYYVSLAIAESQWNDCMENTY